jgi:hypothetical protein
MIFVLSTIKNMNERFAIIRGVGIKERDLIDKTAAENKYQVLQNVLKFDHCIITVMN